LASSLKLAAAVETIQAKGMTSRAHGDDETIITSNQDQYKCPSMSCRPRRMISFKHGSSDGNSMEEDEDIETQERLEANSDGFKKWMLSKRANGKTKAVIRRVYAPNLSP